MSIREIVGKKVIDIRDLEDVIAIAIDKDL